MITYLTAIFASLITLAYAHTIFAAGMYLLPEQGNFNPKEELTVDIKIDSEGEGINAAQGAIRWPTSVLEFIGASKEGSAFNFWVEEPKLGSASSSISFIGGTTKGVSGDALQTLRLTFRARGTGIADISLSDAAITASDGKGTNVLSKTKGARYTVGAEIVPIRTSESALTQEAAPQPVRVARKAIPALQLPQKPPVTVPLYSDEIKWHNHLGEAVAFWEIPDDVAIMAVSLDHSPNTIPQKIEKELATGKSFGVLNDGVWYVHARFGNTVGWGPTAHYRIAIDTKPPLAFELAALEGPSTDDPAPTIRFKTSDALSGIASYQIQIDGGETINVPATEFRGNMVLPLQAPGTHRIVTRAVDQAGNSVEDGILLEIIPIPSPTITFVTKELFLEETPGLTVKGTALPNIDILLRVQRLLRQGKGEIVAQKTARSDEKGNWEVTFDEPLGNGKYVVAAQGQDGRGALSIAVESEKIRVTSKPIIQIGFLQLGKGGAALLLLCILIAGFGGGVRFYKKRQETVAMRVSFAESEIAKIFNLIKEDANRVSKAAETSTAGDDEYALKRLQENIAKMKQYLKKGVRKIKNP